MLGSYRSLRLDDEHASVTELPALLERADFLRLDAYRRLDPSRRGALGQYSTPLPIAQLMASMFQNERPSVSLLDAGAGTGSLTVAFLGKVIQQLKRPSDIAVTAYEIDPLLAEYLEATLAICREECERAGIRLRAEVVQMDFIEDSIRHLNSTLFDGHPRTFDAAILNPPYGKIRSDSETRKSLRSLGIEANNLYTAFLALVTRRLDEKGELVAITPRSFCNGPYFKPFRQSFLDAVTIKRIHTFESRDRTFQDDDVLQETIILHAIKGYVHSRSVLISSSSTPEDDVITQREIEYNQLVYPDDPDLFIHIVPDDLGEHVADRMRKLPNSLEDVGLSVSTGRVVDFRVSDYLRAHPDADTVPLIYPNHFVQGYIKWPNPNSRKPNALIEAPNTRPDLVPSVTYVLVKRFTSKEEKRRIVAAIYDPRQIDASLVGFENHLNYYHANGRGLSLSLAKGLAAFLNSTLIDTYFRQFNGHTQVNATDLRRLRYPSVEQLLAIGRAIGSDFPSQEQIDLLIEQEMFGMERNAVDFDPVRAKRRIDEARGILKSLGFPTQQQNERSALTLLALLDLKPETPWSQARNPLIGITPMMDFFGQYYGKRYAPNTRETVRRQTVHQFMASGLIVQNPDDPSRPVNSGKNVYQIEDIALTLLRTYSTQSWDENLRIYLSAVETLRKRYAGMREMIRIPLVVEGEAITLSPGGQNILIEKIIHEFCPRFTPGGKLLYVGDTDTKWAYYAKELLGDIGIRIETHGKMPDIVVYYPEKNWLVLIEAVTSHGPVDLKRRNELMSLFAQSKAGLVLVTAFMDRRTMAKYLKDISWETEVWVAESPDHMIHFNGERFLGPYT
jgi:adenine-specific DNA-methyltransferase